jgi:predicted glycosyltransferase
MKKRIIFDVGHPAQVHQFKHLYRRLTEAGWEGLFTVKDKEIAIELLTKLDLPYRVVGKNEKGMVRKLVKLPSSMRTFNSIVSTFKPGIILHRFSIHATYVAKLRGIPNIGFADTEHTGLLDRITNPLIDYKLTAYSYEKDFRKNQIRYHGNIELFYLHPHIFAPDPKVLDYLGVKKNEKYVIIRFVSWDAHHDVGHEGLSHEFKLELVNKLSKHARVFITSEQKLTPDLEPYRIQIPVEKMHDALAFAHLYVGEGGTMASEAACIGTPGIYINQLNMGYVKEEAEYGLLHNLRNAEGVIEIATSIVMDDRARAKNRVRLDKFLSHQIDVTAFVMWFVQEFPGSAKTMMADPDHQMNFK